MVEVGGINGRNFRFAHSLARFIGKKFFRLNRFLLNAKFCGFQAFLLSEVKSILFQVEQSRHFAVDQKSLDFTLSRFKFRLIYP